MPRPIKANRDLLYRHYRANGGLLPYDVWLKHQRHERQDDAIVLPPSFWIVCTLAGIGCGALVFGIGHVAGWW